MLEPGRYVTHGWVRSSQPLMPHRIVAASPRWLSVTTSLRDTVDTVAARVVSERQSVKNVYCVSHRNEGKDEIEVRDIVCWGYDKSDQSPSLPASDEQCRRILRSLVTRW